jgi:hypothetical protein
MKLIYERPSSKLLQVWNRRERRNRHLVAKRPASKHFKDMTRQQFRLALRLGDLPGNFWSRFHNCPEKKHFQDSESIPFSSPRLVRSGRAHGRFTSATSCVNQRDLIRRMSKSNPLWGAPRIHGELLKLGIKISQATVGRWMPWRPKVPSPTWRTFLRNHLPDIAAIDMFVVATATSRLLYA